MLLFALLCALPTTTAFLGNLAPASARSRLAASSDEVAPEVSFSRLLVSGFLSKEANFAESFALSKLHEGDSTRWESMVAATDDVPFARKRMMSPSHVYSGLADVLEFAQVRDEGELSSALKGRDAWLAFNVSAADLPAYARLAAQHSLKRVVLGVFVPEELRGEDVLFADAQSTMAAAGVAFTVLKFGEVRRMGEAKYPYRLVRGALPLPGVTELSSALSSEDLMRVLAESVDLPKTFGQVYGMGPGSMLDGEILVYMKSQGWPERVQVGLLMGDMMERVEKKYLEERAAPPKALKEAPKKKSFAGFFSS